ncbi:hypothetical protein [Aliiroseovarius sp. F47248L]|uniref:hypothetical protein n=1 Tax=Aliiroseovarius sp. F47248L TaxID=2926420 RepID=UPI001FF51CED|nr:hypothetical protein [Aliiroseovarius sp. F47248L]MCK0138109.1 hypothetical protein [Aliiroseovarius sp. F47248L]
MSYHFQAGGIRLPEFSRGDRKTQVGSTKHFTGGLVLGENEGVRLGTDSHIETNGSLLLRYHPTTLDLVEQVRFSWYDEHGEYFDHFIDLVATRTDGTVIGYAVRPMKRASHAYQCKLARIKQQAIAQCFLDDFRLFTEEDVCPVALHNAKLFHSLRRPDAFADPVAREACNEVCGTTTVGALVDRTRLEGMGFRAVVRLIGSGHLELVRHERIERSTEVARVRAN